MTWLHWVMLAGVLGGAWFLGSVWRIEARASAVVAVDGETPRSEAVSASIGGDDVNRERGAAMVELAFALPLLVLLIVGGVDITMAVQTRGELQHVAQQIATSDLHEDEAGNLADSIGAVLECFDQGIGGCFPDGLDETVERRQVVLAAVHDGIVLPAFTVRADAVGVVPTE